MKIPELTLEQRQDLAEDMYVTLRMINQWGRGEDDMSKKKSIEVEEKSKGKVKCYEAMFPEIDFNWRII